MSRYTPPKYNKKELQLQWINGIVHMHDLCCGCPDPLEHSIIGITNQEKNLRFTDNEKKQLKKCIFGEEDTHDAADIGEEDLLALFTEDFGEQKDGDDADTG